MSEEIKRILTYLNNQDWYVFEDDYNEPEINHKILEEAEVKILLDYITNLQQENQQLKDVNSFSKRELYKINKDRLEANLKLVEENKKLKEQLELYDNGVIYDSRVDKLETVLDEIREYINIPWILEDNEMREQVHKAKHHVLQILDKMKEVRK